MLEVKVFESDKVIRVYCETIGELEKLTCALWAINQPSGYPEGLRSRMRSDAVELLRKAHLKIFPRGDYKEVINWS